MKFNKYEVWEDETGIKYYILFTYITENENGDDVITTMQISNGNITTTPVDKLKTKIAENVELEKAHQYLN